MPDRKLSRLCPFFTYTAYTPLTVPRSGSTGSSVGMPNFRNVFKNQLKNAQDEMPHGLMREMMETYKPHILTRRRQLLEDCVRDLRLNNDHIHIVEQEMRKAIQVRKQINKKIS